MNTTRPQNTEVSVVMACYNEAPFLRRAIRSILQQDFKAFEFIIIDDGSSDSSWNIISEFAESDDRIVPIKNEENIGLSGSLNLGINLATSDLIARMDADDIALPNRLRLQYEFLLSHDEIDVLGSSAFLINKDSGESRGIIQLPEKHKEIVARVFKKTLVIHPAIMMRKEIFASFGYYDPSLRWAEDADLWFRIHDKIQFHNLPQPLLFYSQKSSVKPRMIRSNLSVKMLNLRRRQMLLSHLTILVKDAFVLSLRYIRNF